MSTVLTRGSLPQNFAESVDAGLRLVQPEPQYLFAKMAMAGRLSEAALSAGAENVRTYAIERAGGKELPPTLDEMVRTTEVFPEAIKTVSGFGANAGDTIKLDRDVFEGGGYSEEERRVHGTQTTSEEGQSLKQEQTAVTLFQYEGPWSLAAGQVRPYVINNFDAEYRANRESLISKVQRHMRRDYTKWLDIVVRDMFRASNFVSLADDVADVSAFTAGAGHQASLELFLKARKAISDREWSPFPSGRYICLVPTAFNTQMVSDVDYRELSKFKDAGRNQLYGYITSIQNIDFFECTTLKSYVASDVVPNAGTVPAGSVVHEALMFGPQVAGMGTGDPPRVFASDNTDYGKRTALIWRSVQAFKTLDVRGAQRVLFQE